MKMFVLLLAFAMVFIEPAVAATATQLPQLNWPAERSDWINVKTDVSPVAKGDGVTDDTAAIQAAFNMITTANDYGGPRTVYLPPGTYKITSTLHPYNTVGIFMVGHGRDTRIVWAGASGGRMLWCDSCPRSRFVGMIWDGAGIAGVGIDHDAKVRYETGMLHKHEEFRNFTTAGIRVGSNQTYASAEIHYQNCLFRNNNNGIRFQQYNDYDNTIQACNFLTNSTGIYCNPGNFNLYECHFEGSSSYDIYGPIHSCSVTRSTSIGSQMFYASDGSRGKNTTMVENCAIDSWANTSGTLVFSGGGPLTIVDCKFTNPPNNSPPVQLAQPSSEVLRVITSGNSYPGTTSLVNPGPNGEVTDITAARARTGWLTSATQSFFSDTDPAYVPSGTLFDAKTGFGATGNGSTDDTAAIQNCINAARNAGNGAIAYIPAGQYRVSSTLNVSGSNYRVGGEGWGTFLNWSGGSSGTMMQVSEAHNITIEALRFAAGSDMTNLRIKQIASTAPSSVFYDYIFAYTGTSYYGGIKFVSLPAGNLVRINSIYGDVNTVDCNAATILTDVAVGAYNIRTSNPSHGAKTGFCGFNFVNTAGNQNGILGAGGFTVTDNQDLIVDSIYSESVTAPWLGASGDGNSTTTGRVTLGGGGKNHGYDQPIVSMNNFSGRVFVNANSVTPQHTSATGPYISGQFNVSGTATCDLTVAGTGFYQVPAFTTATGERLITYANSGQDQNQTGAPELTIPVNQPSGWQGPTAAAFDDLAELGSNFMTAWYAAIDTQPPMVTLTAPASGAVVSNVVAVSATSTDNVAVASVQFQVDGVNLGAPVAAPPYTNSWNTLGLNNGTHTVRAIGYDTSGNSATNGVSVVVSNETQPPTVSLTAPINGALVSNVVPMTATASDNVAVANVQFQVDGVNLGVPVETPPYASSWNTATASNGPHTVQAIAYDTSGNSATNGVSVVVTNAAPPPLPYPPVQGAGDLIVDLTQAGLVNNTGTIWANQSGNAKSVGNFHTLDGAALATSTAFSWNTQSFTALAVLESLNHALVSATSVPSQMAANGHCSAEAWVYAPAYAVLSGNNSDALGYGVQGGAGAPKCDREMCADASATGKSWSFNFGGKDVTWLTEPSLNAWHYLTWTYDGVNAAAYCDGVLDRSQATAGLTTTATRFVVGAGIGGGATDGSTLTSPWVGYIAAVRLWSEVLSQSQITNNYAAGPLADVAIQMFAPTTPANTNVPQGSVVTVSLNAVTNSLFPMTYQWYTDGGSGGTTWTPVAGATGITFHPSTATLGVFQYLVQATNVQYLVGAVSPPSGLNVVAPLRGTMSGGALTLTWGAGALLEASSVNGPWTTNTTATSPFVIYPATNGPARFYRLRQ